MLSISSIRDFIGDLLLTLSYLTITLSSSLTNCSVQQVAAGCCMPRHYNLKQSYLFKGRVFAELYGTGNVSIVDTQNVELLNLELDAHWIRPVNGANQLLTLSKQGELGVVLRGSGGYEYKTLETGVFPDGLVPHYHGCYVVQCDRVLYLSFGEGSVGQVVWFRPRLVRVRVVERIDVPEASDGRSIKRAR